MSKPYQSSLSCFIFKMSTPGCSSGALVLNHNFILVTSKEYLHIICNSATSKSDSLLQFFYHRYNTRSFFYYYYCSKLHFTFHLHHTAPWSVNTQSLILSVCWHSVVKNSSLLMYMLPTHMCWRRGRPSGASHQLCRDRLLCCYQHFQGSRSVTSDLQLCFALGPYLEQEHLFQCCCGWNSMNGQMWGVTSVISDT